MKLYFAGCFSGITADILRQYGIKHKLYSYANEKKEAIAWGSKNLMLDSGAFTAFTQGKTIDIHGYISFLKEFKPEQNIQLDVIGNDKETFKNFMLMQQAGVETLPVIHYKSSKEHILEVLKNSNYLCLGGLVPLSTQKDKLKQWLDYIYSFKEIREKKVHCLGITTKWVLERYPFYSCDSSSALSFQRYPQKDKIIRMQQLTENYKNLYEPAIKKILPLESYITKLWKNRGISWEN